MHCALLDFVEAKQRQPEVEAKITALSGRLFRLEGDDEVWSRGMDQGGPALHTQAAHARCAHA